jgi:hypothetical protein
MNDMEPWVFLPEREPGPEKPPETAREVIRWWERRRLKYNLLVLALFSIGILLVVILRAHYVQRTGALAEWPLVFIFAIMHLIFALVIANLCYTGGWVSEIIVRVVLRDKARRYGAIAYWVGIGLTIILLCTVFYPAIITQISGPARPMISGTLSQHGFPFS